MSSALYLPLYRPAGPVYRCPGETYDINRSVHLARIATGYPPCRTCRHRCDSTPLSSSAPVQTEPPVQERSLFTPLGVRGVYLNELHRKSTGQLAGAFARLLWERNPPSIKPQLPSALAASKHPLTEAASRESRSLESSTEKHSPLVLVGHDARPHSPDLLTGVVQVLRRMSCRVLDAGCVPRPWFERLIATHQTTAALYLGAAGTPPAWSGMNFYLDRALPCTDDFLLTELQAAAAEPLQRPSRGSSGYQTIYSTPEYDDRLRHLFHALRPLKIVVGTPDRLGGEILKRLLSSTACELTLINLPRRETDWNSPEDQDVRQLARHVRERSAHLGCLLSEDLRQIVVLDEQGNSLPYSGLALMAVQETLREFPAASIVVSDSAPPRLLSQLQRLGLQTITAGSSFTATVRAMLDSQAPLGIHADQIWFQEGGLAADGLMLFGSVLQAMSHSDLDLSLLCERISLIQRAPRT